MHLAFADDAKQSKPTREGLGPLVAIGGFVVVDSEAKALESQLDGLCAEVGFPAGEEFKWSPGKELWMRENLVTDARREFFVHALELAREASVTGIVVVEDTTSSPAIGGDDHEIDAAKLFLERVSMVMDEAKALGLLLTDRPGGNRKAEDRFLAELLQVARQGTGYVTASELVIAPVATSSTHVRLLQLADIITSCTLAVVAGESQYSPPVFAAIKPLLRAVSGRVGGVGLKLHPDYALANLYHWLADDQYHWRGNTGSRLPHAQLPYATSPELR